MMVVDVTAKAARTRWSSGKRADRDQEAAVLKDEPVADWTPTRISDRKLSELAQRLDRLHETGDTFAGVTLSPEAYARLRTLPGAVEYAA